MENSELYYYASTIASSNHMKDMHSPHTYTGHHEYRSLAYTEPSEKQPKAGGRRGEGK